MTPEQTRVHALQFALQMNQNNPNIDLNQLFATSDKITDYISGQKPQGPSLWDNEKIIDLKRSADSPEYFFDTHVRIQHPMKGAVPFKLHGYQRLALQTMNTNRFTILNHARQMGISTLLANYALWFALMKPEQTIAVLSYKFVCALDLMDRIRFALDSLPDHIATKVKIQNKGTIAFENGSKIIGRTVAKDAFRGLGINMAIFDSLSHSSHSLAREAWNDLMPRIAAAPNSKVIVASSPGVEEGLFYELWKNANDHFTGASLGHGYNGFAPLKLTWDMHPERDDQWAEVFRQQLGNARFKTEFECEFRPV